jgi:hypothetical protein
MLLEKIRIADPDLQYFGKLDSRFLVSWIQIRIKVKSQELQSV